MAAVWFVNGLCARQIEPAIAVVGWLHKLGESDDGSRTRVAGAEAIFEDPVTNARRDAYAFVVVAHRVTQCALPSMETW